MFINVLPNIKNTLLLLLLSCFSRVRLCATPETVAYQAPHPRDSPGKNTGVGCWITKSCPTLQPHGLQHARLPCPSLSPGVCSNSSPWVNDTVQPSHPLSPFSAPAFSLSQHQGLFQWLSSSHQVVKVLSFSISPSNEYSGLISFRNDWLSVLAVQGTL